MRKRRGNLSYNHTTFLEGLETVLQKLGKEDGIQRITPGMLRKAGANQPNLLIKILPQEVLGGYKLIARKGRTVQDIYIITSMSEEALRQLISQYL